jgi:hypothetical protein
MTVSSNPGPGAKNIHSEFRKIKSKLEFAYINTIHKNLLSDHWSPGAKNLHCDHKKKDWYIYEKKFSKTAIL